MHYLMYYICIILCIIYVLYMHYFMYVLYMHYFMYYICVFRKRKKFNSSLILTSNI